MTKKSKKDKFIEPHKDDLFIIEKIIEELTLIKTKIKPTKKRQKRLQKIWQFIVMLNFREHCDENIAHMTKFDSKMQNLVFQKTNEITPKEIMKLTQKLYDEYIELRNIFDRFFK